MVAMGTRQHDGTRRHSDEHLKVAEMVTLVVCVFHDN